MLICFADETWWHPSIGRALTELASAGCLPGSEAAAGVAAIRIHERGAFQAGLIWLLHLDDSVVAEDARAGSKEGQVAGRLARARHSRLLSRLAGSTGAPTVRSLVAVARVSTLVHDLGTVLTGYGLKGLEGYGFHTCLDSAASDPIGSATTRVAVFRIHECRPL